LSIAPSRTVLRSDRVSGLSSHESRATGSAATATGRGGSAVVHRKEPSSSVSAANGDVKLYDGFACHVDDVATYEIDTVLSGSVLSGAAGDGGPFRLILKLDVTDVGVVDHTTFPHPTESDSDTDSFPEQFGTTSGRPLPSVTKGRGRRGLESGAPSRRQPQRVRLLAPVHLREGVDGPGDHGVPVCVRIVSIRSVFAVYSTTAEVVRSEALPVTPLPVVVLQASTGAVIDVLEAQHDRSSLEGPETDSAHLDAEAR
jgi:hypothetical protein